MPDMILLIDDDADVLRTIGNFFEKLGAEVARELTGEAGLETFDRLRPEVVVLDLGLPGMDGSEVLDRLMERGASVVMLTGTADVPTAVNAMRRGAENFLTKPVDLEHLRAVVGRVAEKARLRRVNRMLVAQEVSGYDPDSLGHSAVMQELARQIALLARSDKTAVLLVGEVGTGKGYVARMIHNLGPRSQYPFVEVTAGVNPLKLESELFGNDPGASGDMDERNQGVLELSDRGTIFLDDIGRLALELQSRILKLLETGSFRRMGGSRDIPVDVRIIAGTSMDIAGEVEAGNFREDLYYRLSVMPLHIPPVRDRSEEDQLELINALMHDLRSVVSGGPERISVDAMERLLGYNWPGNIRGMRNVLERALILARGKPEVMVEHLPGELRARSGPGDRRHMPLSMDELEHQHIERTLRHHNGNRTRAAAELGISRATLINKIKRYEIPL